jgi:hypothetical protein
MKLRSTRAPLLCALSLYLFRTLLEPALIHSLQSVDSVLDVDRFSKVG